MRTALLAVALSLMLASVICVDAESADGSQDTGWYSSEDADYTYSVFGASSEEYESTLIGISSSSSIVFVQSALEGYPLKRIAPHAFDGLKADAVVIPSTVESVSVTSFSDCSIGSVYFLCDHPSGLEVPDGTEVFALEGSSGWKDVGTLELGTYSGEGCSLEFFVIDGEAVIHRLIGGTEVSVPSQVVSGGKEYPVKQIGAGSFRGTGIASVTIPEGVTKIGVRAFYLCRNLERALLPESISAVCDEAFRECYALGNVDLRNAAFLGFESFRMCYGFTAIKIPDSVVGMGDGAFYVCSGVESVVVGSGIGRIADRSFGYAPDMESLDIRGIVSSVGDFAFCGCPSLASVCLPDVAAVGDSAFKGCRMLDDLRLSDRLVSLGDNAFEGCLSLVSIRLPDTVSEIGDMAFYQCRSLTDVYFSGDMPRFGTDVFAGTDVTVHCLESRSGSWSGYSGSMVVDDDGHGIRVIATMAMLMIAVSAVLLIMRSYRKDRF